MLTWCVLLLGFVAGCAMQLQQETLFQSHFYLLFMLPFVLLAGRDIAQAAIKNVAKYGFAANRTGALAALPALPTLPAYVRWFALMVAAGLLGFALCGLRASSFATDALDPNLQGRDIQVVGVVAVMPQKNESGLRFRFSVESARSHRINGNNDSSGTETAVATPVALPPELMLSWYSGVFRSEDTATVAYAELQRGNPDLRAGERWSFTVRLKSPHGNANPHGFDYELWLWEQGVGATGTIRATPANTAQGTAPRMLGSTWQHPIESARQKVRDAIEQRITDPRLAGVLAALVVGDQAAIDRADWDIYRATGVAHLMSISGLHVTMFAWGAALLVGGLWRRSSRAMTAVPAQHVAGVGGLLLATAYAVFSGWGVPSQRTIIMLAAVLLLRLSGKRWPWPMVWLLAMAAVVVLDPWALLQAGFWLSFVAVGVLFASDAGQPRKLKDAAAEPDVTVAQASKLPAPAMLAAWWGSLKGLLREQWVVTLALTPLSLLLFQQVSLVGLLANLLAIPWVTLVITPLAMLGLLLPVLWDAAAACVGLLGMVLQWLAALPHATFSVAAPALWMGAVGVLGGLLLVAPIPWALRCAGLPLLLPALLFTPLRPAMGQFELLAADIGQGNAIIVRTQSHSLLFDAGPRFSRESDAGQRTLVPLLRALDERLDMVMLSHRDTDHIGGAVAVLKMQPQAVLVSSIEDEHELQLFKQAIRCSAGQSWQWDGVQFEVLHPLAADYDTVKKSNAMSCVLRISNSAQTALLTGDIEAAQEARLIADAAAIRTDVLLVPHHGSKTSSTEAFLNAAQPRIALVQSGYRNRFNHPAPDVVERYVSRNVQMVDSPRCGAAMWSSASPDTVVCHRDMQRRYWNYFEKPYSKKVK